MREKKIAAAAMTAAAIMLVVSACGGAENATEVQTGPKVEADADGAPSGGVAGPDTASGTFIAAVSQEPQDLAAQGVYKEVNAAGLRNVIETLIAYDPSGVLIPVLATSWEQVDAQTVRFELREGVKFHDGTELNGAVAAESVNFVWSKENSFTIQEFAGPGAITAKAIGPMTIEVTSSAPDPLLEFRLTLNGISSADQIKNNPGAHFDTPIGTGPYTFVEWRRGQYWSAKINPDWWGWTAEDVYGDTLPLYKEMRIIFRPEDGARSAVTQAGEATMSVGVSASECARADGAQSYTCFTKESDVYLYGRLDHSLYADERLQDPRVRQALFEAVDYQGIVSLLGLASLPKGQLEAEGMVGFNPGLEQYPYDPANARRLLDEARADGVDVDGLEIDIVGRNSTAQISDIVQAISGFYTAIGIKNTVSVQPGDLFNPRVRIDGYRAEAPRAMLQVHVKNNPSADAGIQMVGNFQCPDLDNPTGPSRSSVYCDKFFDYRLSQALIITGDRRDAVLQELNRYIHERHLTKPLALLDKAYLLENGLSFRTGIDHRLQLTYLSRS